MDNILYSRTCLMPVSHCRDRMGDIEMDVEPFPYIFFNTVLM